MIIMMGITDVSAKPCAACGENLTGKRGYCTFENLNPKRKHDIRTVDLKSKLCTVLQATGEDFCSNYLCGKCHRLVTRLEKALIEQQTFIQQFKNTQKLNIIKPNSASEPASSPGSQNSIFVSSTVNPHCSSVPMGMINNPGEPATMDTSIIDDKAAMVSSNLWESVTMVLCDTYYNDLCSLVTQNTSSASVTSSIITENVSQGSYIERESRNINSIIMMPQTSQRHMTTPDIIQQRLMASYVDSVGIVLTKAADTPTMHNQITETAILAQQRMTKEPQVMIQTPSSLSTHRVSAAMDMPTLCEGAGEITSCQTSASGVATRQSQTQLVVSPGSEPTPLSSQRTVNSLSHTETTSATVFENNDASQICLPNIMSQVFSDSCVEVKPETNQICQQSAFSVPKTGNNELVEPGISKMVSDEMIGLPSISEEHSSTIPIPHSICTDNSIYVKEEAPSFDDHEQAHHLKEEPEGEDDAYDNNECGSDTVTIVNSSEHDRHVQDTVGSEQGLEFPTGGTSDQHSQDDIPIGESNETDKQQDRSLQGIMKTQAQDNVHACDKCDKVYYLAKSLDRHKKVHSGFRPYKCLECGWAFAVSLNLKHHMRTHTGEKPFVCQVCDRRFIRRSCLKTHMRTHTQDKVFACDQCDKVYNLVTSLYNHKKVHSGVKPYKCSKCDWAFSKSSDLINHMRSHTGEKPYTCQVCQRGFTRMWGLKEHMRTHTQEKPFQCEECGERFAWRTTLTEHVNIHLGFDPFQCDKCGVTYTSRKSLDNHLKAHKKEMKSGVHGKQTLFLYQCEECKKRFSSHELLQIHKKCHQQAEEKMSDQTVDKQSGSSIERLYKCNVCYKPFRRRYNLENHKRTHTEETPYKCE